MGAQLPSGILLFFALALCLAAVFVFFSGGEGVSAPSALIGIALVVLGGAFVWLMGVEGGQETSRSETTRLAPESTGTAETTSASERTGQSQGETTSSANYCVEKQFSQATRGLDPQQASDYETGVINEAVARAVDPRTVLTERGFPC